MEVYHNDILSEKWTDESHNIIIRKISLFNDKDYDTVAKKFITLKTFNYTNTLYGALIEDTLNQLSNIEKISLLSILEEYENEIDKKIQELFDAADNASLKEEFEFTDSELLNESRTELFSKVKGGQYCEMLLSYLAVKLGYEKILPKPYFEWGLLSPTGIDVPYIDLNNKSLLLGECKIYKNIKAALKSCYKDLNDIYNGNKLDKEVKEWRKKITSIQDNISDIIAENINDKNDLLNYINEVKIVGFVMGNKIENLKAELTKFNDFSKKNKISVYMITIPLESKDSFVEACHKVISDMKKEVESHE